MSGWDDLDPQDSNIEDVPEVENKYRDLNLLFARTFGTHEGQKVLEWMREFYLELPCWQPGADPSFGQWREGQNSVIRDIEARIKKAKSNERSK